MDRSSQWSSFNLPMKTSNEHHVTLKKDGLVKAFYHKRDYTEVIARIKTIYAAQLPNVEQGVTNCTTITITTIGRKLHGLSKQAALDGATRAEEQLHSIGMAHCEICVDNLFMNLESNVVFLGDLEYCRPVGDAPPADIRRGDPQDDLALLQCARSARISCRWRCGCNMLF